MISSSHIASNFSLSWGGGKLSISSPNFSVFVEGIISVFHSIGKSLSKETIEKYQNISDDKCMKRLAAGDEEPFQVLFDRYGSLVFGYCCRLLSDRGQAEDASQEVWVKVIRFSKRYKSKGKYRAWLLQIARTTCISIIRKNKPEIYEVSDPGEIEDTSKEDILNLMQEKEKRHRLKECINLLQENQKIILIVWMTEEQSYEQIAKNLGVTVSAVKSTLFRAKQNLKHMMDLKNA